MEVTNYRPVSLPSDISKVVEKRSKRALIITSLKSETIIQVIMI